MAPTTRETVCTNGFVIQREEEWTFFRFPRNNYQKKLGPARTSRIRAFRAGPKTPGRRAGPGRLGRLRQRAQVQQRVQGHQNIFFTPPQRRLLKNSKFVPLKLFFRASCPMQKLLRTSPAFGNVFFPPHSPGGADQTADGRPQWTLIDK